MFQLDSLPRLLPALAALWGTYCAGQELPITPSRCHLGLSTAFLRKLGLTNGDLDTLLSVKLLIAISRDEMRASAASPGLAKERNERRLSPKSAWSKTASGGGLRYALTNAGAAAVEQVLRRVGELISRHGLEAPPSAAKPRWDGRKRELWLGEELVLRLHRSGENQEIVLAAFEESKWRARIDNPLGARGKLSAEERLHNVVSKLNGGQNPHLIQFACEGKGVGATWRLLP